MQEKKQRLIAFLVNTVFKHDHHGTIFRERLKQSIIRTRADGLARLLSYRVAIPLLYPECSPDFYPFLFFHNGPSKG